MEKIKVKNSGPIELTSKGDVERGNLFIGEEMKNVPFDIKRFYVMRDFDKVPTDSTRGEHAHKKLEQCIFCLNGSFTLHLDDSTTKQDIVMSASNSQSATGIRLGAKLWHSMKNFSKDCVILVVANDYYDETDYIRDYNEFLSYVNK